MRIDLKDVMDVEAVAAKSVEEPIAAKRREASRAGRRARLGMDSFDETEVMKMIKGLVAKLMEERKG